MIFKIFLEILPEWLLKQDIFRSLVCSYTTKRDIHFWAIDLELITIKYSKTFVIFFLTYNNYSNFPHSADLILRGTTPFYGVIFYLWTDPAEINTEYVKLKKITFCSWKFFDFRNSFWKKLDFYVFLGIYFWNFKRIEVKNYQC